jgi:hypothetical protein
MNHARSIILTLVALMLLGLSAGCIQTDKETGNPPPGTTTSSSGTPAAGGGWSGDAKDFSYTTFAGMSGKASEFAGKPLVVNFWAAW